MYPSVGFDSRNARGGERNPGIWTGRLRHRECRIWDTHGNGCVCIKSEAAVGGRRDRSAPRQEDAAIGAAVMTSRASWLSGMLAGSGPGTRSTWAG